MFSICSSDLLPRILITASTLSKSLGKRTKERDATLPPPFTASLKHPAAGVGFNCHNVMLNMRS